MRAPTIVRRFALAFGAAGTLLSGCVVGPSYRSPPPPAPPSSAFSSTLTPYGGTAEQPPANWWKLYNDPAIDGLVQEALTHNKNLLVAAANLAEARAALSLARAGRFPATTFSSNASYGVSSTAAADAVAAGQGPVTPSAYYAVGLDASYEVDLFGRIRRAIQAARADYEAQRAAEDVTRISVAGETTRAYLNACAYAEELAVARQSLNIVNQNYALTVTQARYGVASEFDLSRALQLVDQTRATLPGFEGQRRAALFELAVLTGKPPEEISRAADACKTPPRLNTAVPIGDIQSLFRRRPDVREAERRLAGDFARIGVATANLFPTVTIGASGLTASNTISGLTSLSSLSYGIGPGLSWAFPNILVALAQVREARATASASYAAFQQSVLQALQDTEEAVTNYGAEIERNVALVASRDQSQIAYKLAQVEFQNGAASYLDILTAETNLVDANTTLASSDEALVSDQVTLFKALGGGWEQAPDIRPLPLTDAKTNKTIDIH